MSLFRKMMREARHFNDYNFRAYAMRRVRGGFEKNRHLEGYVRICLFLFLCSHLMPVVNRNKRHGLIQPKKN